MNKHYIRIGDIPPNEVSGIYRSGEKIGEEKGVSVFDAIEIDGKWRIVLPTPLSEKLVNDLCSFEMSLHCKAYSTPKILLVTGDEVGIGSDNEPLLKNVKVIQELNDI